MIIILSFTQLVMLQLVTSLVPGNNKLPKEGKEHNLFAYTSSAYHKTWAPVYQWNSLFILFMTQEIWASLGPVDDFA